MGVVDYIFNIVRSVSDLLHILCYLFVLFIIFISAFYINSKEKYDARIDNTIWIWWENNARFLSYVLANVPSKQWVFREYEWGRFNFLFASGRLPYFLLISKAYSSMIKDNYSKISKFIKDFFKNTK